MAADPLTLKFKAVLGYFKSLVTSNHATVIHSAKVNLVTRPVPLRFHNGFVQPCPRDFVSVTKFYFDCFIYLVHLAAGFKWCVFHGETPTWYVVMVAHAILCVVAFGYANIHFAMCAKECAMLLNYGIRLELEVEHGKKWAKDEGKFDYCFGQSFCEYLNEGLPVLTSMPSNYFLKHSPHLFSTFVQNQIIFTGYEMSFVVWTII